MCLSYSEIETKIAQYAHWLREGDEVRRLGYPRCSPIAMQIPSELPEDAVPEISDEEGLKMEGAMITLKTVDREAYQVIVARFFYGVESDTKVGRILRLGNRNRVSELRRRAYSILQVYLEIHKNSEQRIDMVHGMS